MKFNKILTFFAALVLFAATASAQTVYTGTISETVTLTDGANITLNNATITGGIVCEGSATITLVGTNSVTGATQKAGIQIGGSGTTLTIRGEGSLSATGGNQSAGIGLSRIWNYDSNVSSGDIVIEGGTITATGGNWGSGIGIGTVKNTNNDNSTSVQFGDITIKGGSVTAIGGNSGDGIGKGHSYSGPTITIGTVTIYDAIEMLDASSIKDFASVVYMHGGSDVTANKTDYFTIVEDGDRRIIVPKDNTDYTITLADGIEHGTLTAASTAKYMETVTINATPDFGYRLVRLVVKDAQNNDVASTGNTFLMPKGNVTVSAVFEQGTHGTTEFAWSHYSSGGYVTDATIYDGLTTVNIQETGQNAYTGTSYSILKYEGYTQYKFRLDNNVYEQAIPFTGTGEFVQNNNPTKFYVTDNSALGYYDITLTDASNGKWSISIVKTAAQMDAVPDQTYTGSEITPEPLVTAGSLSLTKGTDYEYSYSDNTNVGTAKVKVTFKGNYASLGSVEKTFRIIKLLTHSDITIAAIPDQTYSGSEIEPEITVTDGENTLTLGTDYTVSYSDNINAGTAKATITGTNNYSGTVEKTFTILLNTTVSSAQADPYTPGTYYTTFYDSTTSYVADCEVYYVTANADGKFTLVKAAGNIVKAGEGVILKATKETVTLSPTNTSASYDSRLTGSNSETSVTNALVLSLGENGVRFYKYSGTMGAHKAYLPAQ